MTAHADASPSASSIWIACPASVTKARGRKRLPTIYTAEGTAAHEVAELLIHGLPAPDNVTVDGMTFAVDDDMVDAVERYVTFVEQLRKKSDEFDTEVSVSVPTVGGETIFGTADTIAYNEKTRTLDVVDLKYGKGVVVTAKGNSQLRIYALGAIYKLSAEKWVPVDTIRMTIIQPRTEIDLGGNTEEIDIYELTAWQDTVLNIAVEKLSRNDQTETTGPHCRWCVRAGECKSLAALAQKDARVVFDPNTQAFGPNTLTDQELATILDSAELIASWIEKVRAEASHRIDLGRKVPGWKLVAKRAMRKWIDANEAMAELADEYPSVYADMIKLDTPAAVERALKRHRKPADIVDTLVTKESSGTTLVRETDSREEVKTDAKSVFDMLKLSLALSE